MHPARSSRRRPWRSIWIRSPRARGGNVAIIFAFLAPVLLLLIGGVVDLGIMLSTRMSLQDSTDAAALAASAAAAKNPGMTEADLESIARSVLNTNYLQNHRPLGDPPQLTAFHVCTPAQQDCTDANGPMKMQTVSVAAMATAPCLLGRFVPNLCPADGGTSKPVNVTTTTTIGAATTFQINMLLDTSGSMIVGASADDVNRIAAWTQANWSAVKPLGGDSPPCAFACHDMGGDTGPSDMAMGLTNAHAAGAVTRFDVMMASAQSLVGYVQTQVTQNQQLSRNTYLFNISNFDTSLHPNVGGSNLSYIQAACVLSQAPQAPCTQAAPAIGPGLDTALNESMTSAVNSIGANGDGTSANSPVKFLILVTDGLESNRDSNWCGGGAGNWAPDPNWAAWDAANEPKNRTPPVGDWPNWPQVCVSSPTAAPINLANCDAIKKNGVVLAVLETPYVPLDGTAPGAGPAQDPTVAPYERTVRKVIYPAGPNGGSALHDKLSKCASDGYFFSATSASDIQTGFFTLTDKFLTSSTYIQR